MTSTRFESKKEQLKRAVLADLRSGRYKEGDRLPSEREFMERYAISRITAKLALNELEAVGAVCRRKGSGTYAGKMPAAEVEGPLEIRSRVGFVLNHKWHNHVAFAMFFKALRERLDPSVLVRIYFHNYFMEAAYAREGMDTIVADASTDEEALRNASASGVKVIRLFRECPDEEYVKVDAEAGGREQARYLFEKGHRKIATFPFSGAASPEFKENFLGLSRGCAELGMELARAPLEKFSDIHNIGQALDYLLNARKGTTAFACSFSSMALCLLSALESRGLRVPDDYSVISMDNYYFSDLVSPPLTTFRMPLEEMAEALAARLGDASASPLRLSFLPTLIERDSVRAI